MKLKATLDSIDGLDAALHPAYTEKDGKYILNIEGYDPNEVETLRSTMRRVKEEKKAAETELKNYKERLAGLPDDFNMDEYNRLVDSAGGDINQKLADQKSRLDAQHKTALDKVTGERDDANGKLKKLHVDNALLTAISKINVAEPFTDAVHMMFKDKVKVDYEGDEAIITIDNMPVVDHLKTWAGTDKGKHYVSSGNNGGGGGGNQNHNPVNKADNPWTKEGFNLTLQGEILQSDPNRAAQLKAAAGVK